MEFGIVPSLLREPDAVREAIRRTGGTPVNRDLTEIDDLDAIPVTGDDAVHDAIEAGIAAPLLPIETRTGLGSIPGTAIEEAVTALIKGNGTTIERQSIDLAVPDGTDATAISEIALVTDEPAEISEFAIMSGGNRVAQYRADGTVVATPPGSCGYARAVGGPILAPGIDSVVTITIAPYRIDPDHWILPPDDIEITVTRDESDVVAIADGMVVGPIETGDPVRITKGRPYRTLTVPPSESPFSTRTD